MGQYLPIVALLVLAVLFSLISFLASKILAPRRMTLAKQAPYESGIVPGKEPPHRFPVRFYLIAMIFIVFDIEIIFLYPWAVTHQELGLFGLVAVAIFAASVFESFLYLLSKGALEWGPIRRVAPRTGMIGPERTASSTVRRVGTEGRYRAAEQDVLADLAASRPAVSADHGGHDVASTSAGAGSGGSSDGGGHGGTDGDGDGAADDRSDAAPAHTGVQ